MIETSAPGGETRPALDARQLTKSFAGVIALNSVDLTVEPGEVHALLGENGSGKSTFIKILSGYHVPDAGSEVHIDGELMSLSSPDSSYALGCRFVHQDLGLIDSSSVVDNLCMNTGFPTKFGTVRQRAARRQARADLAKVGLEQVNPSALVGTLTPALKTGVAVARALRQVRGSEVKLLVLDEPTATLPDNEVQNLLDIVRQVAASGVGVLYVTHRLDEVFQVADRVTVLRDGHKAATEPTTALDRKRLINLLIGSELEEIHAAVENLDAPATDQVPALQVEHLRHRRCWTCRSRSSPVTSSALPASPARAARRCSARSSAPTSATAAPCASTARRCGPSAPTCRWVWAWPTCRPTARSWAGSWSSRPARTWRCRTCRRSGADSCCGAGPSARRRARWFERLSVRPVDAVEQRLMAFSGGNQQKVLFGKWLRRTPGDLPARRTDPGGGHRRQGGAAPPIAGSGRARCRRARELVGHR